MKNFLLIYSIIITIFTALSVGFIISEEIEGQMLAQQNREYKNYIRELKEKGVLPYED